MANITIPQLPAAIAITGNEQLEAVQSGTSVRVSAIQIANLAGNGVLYPQTASEKTLGIVPSNYNYPECNVLRYGADPTNTADCTTAFQSAVNVCTLAQVPIFVPTGTYYVAGTILVNGAYFSISGEDQLTTTITGYKAGTTSGFINSTNNPSPDTSYPTTTYPGPMSGSLFYCVTLVYYSQISNLTLDNYKFGFAFLNPFNGPTFTKVRGTAAINALVFCYQGCQNYNYVDCGSNGGPIHISSATCYPAGSPYAGFDNYYTDGFSYTSTNTKTQSGIANSYFDSWFQNSILRPTVPSVNVASSGYVYPFSTSSTICKPSGWAICYMPFRNQRDSYGFTLNSPGLEFCGTYGMGVLNTSVWQGVINGYEWEPASVNTLAEHFVFGSIHSLIVENVTTTLGGTPQVPFYILTGQAYNTGLTVVDNTNTTFINCGITNPTYNGTTLPITTGFASNTNTVAGSVAGQVILVGQNTANSSSTYDGRTDGAIVVNLSPTNAGVVSTDTTPIDSWNFSCILPIKMPDGYFHRYLSIGGAGTLTSGILNVNVLNTATGETDYGQFYLQFGANPFSLTTSAATNNGDQYIYVTSAPSTIPSPFSQFTLNGTTITINSYDSANKRLVVQGVVSGLSATAASGSTISWTIFSKTLTPFSRGYIDVVQLSSNNYGFISNIASYTQTMSTSDQAVYISSTFTNTKLPLTSRYSAATPTTGMWSTGAIVYNSTPVNGNYVGWVCTSGGGTPSNPGTPAVWQPFGAIGTSGGGGNLQFFNSPYTGAPATIGTWTKPAGAKLVRIIAMGGGGGGGSGALCAVSGSCSGGAGGGGGAYYDATFDATQIPTTLSVYVGAGGLGGGFVSNSVGAGNPGLAGGETYVVDSTTLQWVYVWGGAGGAGGSADGSVVLGGGGAGIWGFGSGSTGGTYGGGNGIGDSTSTIVYPAIPFAGAGGLGTSSANGPPSHPAGSAMYGGGGGGAGGCIKAGAVTSPGNGGWAYGDNVGSSAGASGTPPGPGSTGYTFNYMGGSGGGGGGSTVGVTYSGAKGGDANGGVIGQNYGAGGGGGGAAIWRTVETSGKGGAGAPGFVLFITTF